MESSPVYDCIGFEEVKTGLAEGAITLIDVRDHSSWLEGRIPGSRSIPCKGDRVKKCVLH